MKKDIKFGFIIAIALVMLSASVMASMLIPANENALANGKAPENSPVIDLTGNGEWGLERVDFIHYAKPDFVSNPAKNPNCYKLLGVKWLATPVNYTINPTNPYNLPETFITSAISTSAETWDNATATELLNNAFGVDYSAQYGVQNFQNAIAFGDYPNSRVIAVTTVWFTRVGKRIVEFDMLFNTDFAWGDATVDSTVMDLQNIATHELGHSVGLDDLYNSTCNNVTMYGYSNNGETQKRTLEQPDIAGLQKMYGA